MKVLMIGGTGLISTEISNRLLAGDDDLTVYNRGVTKSRLISEPKTIRGDRKDHSRFEEVVRKSGPWDCIIDINCSDPADAESMYRAARGVATQVIFCSTTNVYPKPAARYPVNEDEPLGAKFKNGLDKALCEAIHFGAHQRGDYNATVLRPAHTYGDIGMILHSLGSHSSFLDRMMKGKAICVHGDGYGLWSACHADDVARGFVAACNNQKSYGEAYNVSSDEWITWKQYYEVIAECLKVPELHIINVPTRVLTEINPQRSAQCERSFQYPGIYDNSRAREDLKFRCEISLREGLERNLRWLISEQKIEPFEEDPEYDEILNAYLDGRWNSAV
jgi:nucleoside-diphosphate-sugar epimerase